MFKFPITEDYCLVAGTEDTESFLSSPETSETTLTPPPPPKSRISLYTIGILLSISFIVTFALGFYLWRNFLINLDNICTRYTSKYSQILDDVNVSYHVENFDGRFVKENIYRQVGSPEVDAAWEALGVGFRPSLLPASRASEAGLTQDNAHAREKYGGGYPVFVEGLHQLHCLSLVRQSVYYNYDYYLAQGKEAFGDSPEGLHWHVSHCVDFIRQRLMCTMDTDVFGSVWVGNRSNPHLFVNFNTKHVCKNFDDIRSWAERNQMPESGPEDFYEPPTEDTRISRWAP